MILENYKSGNLIKSTAGYKYFLPTKINEEITGQNRNRIFVFRKYFDLFK
jgi:hypothetical protein